MRCDDSDGVCGCVRMMTVLGVCALMMQLPAFLSGVVSDCFWLAQFILFDGVRVFAAN